MFDEKKELLILEALSEDPFGLKAYQIIRSMDTSDGSNGLTLNPYLKELNNSGYIESQGETTGPNRWEITQEGLKYLEGLEKLRG